MTSVAFFTDSLHGFYSREQNSRVGASADGAVGIVVMGQTSVIIVPDAVIVTSS
jgi:hypothetical protein